MALQRREPPADPAPPATETELAAWLRLASTPGLGPAALRQLLAWYGLPEAVFDAPYAELAARLGPKAAAALLDRAGAADPREQRVQAGLAWARLPGHRLLTLADTAYPARLLDLHDPPTLLWVDGDPTALSRPMLAVIGARHGTPAGQAHAHDFSVALGDAGWTIVSGLAAGIDAAAHDGALATTAGTVALIGTGPDIVYPARHRPLAARIRAHGALATELPPGTPPLAHHFPRRNRLIAALAHGVLVVEAARQSGSLITARQAAELGREVFAMPGSIDSPLAKGCHALIRQGAKLVESAQDVLEEVRRPGSADAVRAAPAVGGACAAAARADVPADVPAGGAGPDGDDAAGAGLAGDDPRRRVLAALGWDPADLDRLVERTGLPVATLLATLAGLVLDDRIQQVGADRWQRRG